jgi:hypothetical protein
VTWHQRLTTAFPVLLVLAGLSLISYGMWLAWPPAGFIVAGLSCLGAEMWREDRSS